MSTFRTITREKSLWLSIIDNGTEVFVNIFNYISKVKFCSGIYKNRSSFKKTYASWIQSSFDNTISDCKMIGYRSLAEASMNGTLSLIFEVQHPVGAEKKPDFKNSHFLLYCPRKEGQKTLFRRFFSVCSVYILWKYPVQVIMVSSTCAPLFYYK